MRRINSAFHTIHISEEGQKLSNRDYFGYVEMDDFACYVLADSLDEELSVNSAKLVVESIIRNFTMAPSMKKRRIKKYIQEAHKELLQQKRGLHLKASVVVAVTNYQKLRYWYVGNTRLYLIRNDKVLLRTFDQSLTQNLVEEQKLPLDQVATHEERNNLYSFLGKRGIPNIQISKKKSLENGDMFLLFTKGVWEQCPDKEFLDIINSAKEPEEILHETEDFLLKQQETKEVDNYTLVVTSVNKVYQSPKKRWTIKKVLLIVLPIVLLVGGIGLGWYFKQKSVQEKRQSLASYMESGETYLYYDNYVKAAQEYGEAKKLAESLKEKEDAKEADQNQKLAEQIVLADEAMLAQEYNKAMELYEKAKELSVQAGNIGKTYIENELKRVGIYIEVFDLIAIGERKEEYGNLEGAIEAYKEAKEKATQLYYSEGKAEAIQKLAAVQEKMEKAKLEEEQEKEEQKKEEEAKQQEEEARQKEEEEKIRQEEQEKQELKNQQIKNDIQNAIDLENKGNELLAEGQYESAITFYQTAKAIYTRVELKDLAKAIDEKVKAAKAGIVAEEAKKAEQANAVEEES